MRKPFFQISLILFSLIVLVSCSGAKKQLGLQRETPDEFAVMKRAPLELPPDFTLRPPRPGAARPQEVISDSETSAVVYGRAVQTQTATRTSGEDALLQKAGAENTNSEIRQIIDQETNTLQPKDESVSQRLFGFGGDNETEADEAIDPFAETERLKESTPQE